MDNCRESAKEFNNFHLVWTTKYRKAVLIGGIANRARELIREVCKNNNVGILAGHVSKDHVHLLVSIPPNISISQLVQYIKGFSSRKSLEKYKELEKQFWGQHLWGRGYFARSCGTVSNKVIIDYIETQRLLSHAYTKEGLTPILTSDSKGTR